MKTNTKLNSNTAKLAHRVLCVLLTVGLVTPAHARLVESAETTGYSYQGEKAPVSTWVKIKVEAKKTVDKWWNVINEQVATWTGEKPQPTVARMPAQAQPIQVAATPEQSVQNQQPQVADTQPAPTQIAPVVVGGAAPRTVTMSAAALATPPAVRTTEQTQFAQVIQETQKTVRSQEAITVANPGRVGTTVLPKTRIGVPVFALATPVTKKDRSGKSRTKMVAVKEIPRLDIGLEKTISKNDFIPPQMMVGFKAPARPKELPTPALVSQKTVTAWTKKPVPLVAKAQNPKRGAFQLGQMVTQKRIADVPLNMEQTKVIEALKPVKMFSTDDLNMVAAVILYEKGDKCHLAAGLLADLADIKTYAEEANFYLGVCAHQMGFHSEAVNRLLEVVRIEHKEFLKDAITNLVEDLPRQYDPQVSAALKGLKKFDVIEDKARDNANYVLARAAHARDNFPEAVNYAGKVREKSTVYPEARYLYAIGLYGEKKLKESEAALLALREWMTKAGKADKNLEALIAVNLARMRFVQGRYQAAHEEYMRVPKDQPVWVQALIEQGWTQLNTQDPAGAIGNMYSLHSPYFKSVFMPESWVVRTIGYIDICQFGDAYRTLTKMEQLHTQWLGTVNRYTSAHTAPNDYYNTVRNYLKGRSDADVDGLPHQIIREVARQRGFLNVQNALNGMEDEISQYGFIYNMVKKDQAQAAARMQQAKQRLIKIKSDIVKANATPELKKTVPELLAQKRNEEVLVTSYEFLTQLYEKSRKGYLQLRTIALSRIDRDKAKMRTNAGQQLMSHMRDIRSRIAQLLEGNEFLRYEIFSGSGENIRYQVSGGTTAETKRIPANIKPQKILNWEFDGEYWEDEIGSYRSTLKNNCPNSRVHSAAEVLDGGKKTAQNF